eukprot:SAG31_NODE_2906_length_4924_cov_4.748187_3_plen_154_part_00
MVGTSFCTIADEETANGHTSQLLPTQKAMKMPPLQLKLQPRRPPLSTSMHWLLPGLLSSVALTTIEMGGRMVVTRHNADAGLFTQSQLVLGGLISALRIARNMLANAPVSRSRSAGPRVTMLEWATKTTLNAGREQFAPSHTLLRQSFYCPAS